MKLHGLTLSDFVNELASSSPAPGGGSVAALGGSLAAGLVSMVGELTRGREKYADVQDDIVSVCDRGKDLAVKLLSLIDEDTEAFSAFMAAMKLPKDTDDQKAARKAAMQEAAKGTAEVPLRTLELCAQAEELALLAMKKGNSNAVTDAASAGQFARAAAASAAYNVRINLKSIKDAAFVEEKLAQTGALLNRTEKTFAELDAMIEKVLS